MQYTNKFQKERPSVNAMQYSNRSQPTEGLEMGHLDPQSRAQYKMDADRSASKTVGSSSYRSDAQNLKPTRDGLGLTDSSSRSTSGRPVDSRYADFSKIPSSQNPYSHKSEISERDPLTPTSAMDKRYPTDTGYENRRMNFDRDRRMDDSPYISRHIPDASFSGPGGKYKPPDATKYSHRERYPQSTEVEMAQNIRGTAQKKYSSPREEDLRKTIYDKKYQMELQKRQADVLGGSRLQREMGELDQQGTERRLDSPHGRYGTGRGTESEGIESTNRRLHNAHNTRLSSTSLASSSKPEQRHEIAQSADPLTARKQFTKAERVNKIDMSDGSKRDRVYSDLNEKTPAKSAIRLKDDNHGDYYIDRESVSSNRKHVQIDERKQSTASARERFQLQSEKQPVMNHSRQLQLGVVGSSTSHRKAEDSRQVSERESSFSLQRMKEDLLRDQAKLDRQLVANSDARTPRFDNQQLYDAGRYSDMYDADLRRSAYATDDRMVRLSHFMIETGSVYRRFKRVLISFYIFE